MTESMIERVARAICRANCGPRMQRDEPDRVECQVENGWSLWEDEARAAIEAMREPTERICKLTAADHDMAVAEVAVVWDAMVANALRETTTTAA